MKKRIISLVLALFMLSAMAVPALASTDATAWAVGEPYYTAELADLLSKESKLPENGEKNGTAEWGVFACSIDKLGEVDKNYPAYVESCVNALGDKIELNDVVRWLLALRSLQGNSAQSVIAGKLLETLLAWNFTKETGTWGIAYALIVFDAYKIESEERNALRSILFEAQHEDGGYNYQLKISAEDQYSKDSDPDTTAAVLTALAPYRAEEKTAVVIQKAIAYLKSVQLESGGFGMFGESADSAAQVIIALCSLGLDPRGADMLSKSGKSMVDSMESFRQKDHSVEGYDKMFSGYQVLLALTALHRFDEKQGGVFVFDSTTVDDKTPSTVVETALWVKIALGVGGVVLIVGAVLVIVVVVSRKKKRA
ncbi:MAG: terpene cyclase/mutase family protein [Oscillospiraceae bacterium]|nr:terpene cyclase/mutase family protein [Oscillospiraceae bacterium]